MTIEENFIPSTWSKTIEAIGWDLDGTLYRSDARLTELIHKKQYQAVAGKECWSLRKARAEFEKKYRKLGSHTKVLTEFGVDGISFFLRFWDSIDLSEFIKIDEKLVLMFSKLKNKRNFMISNSNRVDQIKKKLKLIGLKPGIFEFYVSTLRLRSVKPDAKPFLTAVNKLNLLPSQILYVGDRERTDILGAKNVGMRTCMVWGRSKEADISLATVYDVEKLF